MIRIYLFSILLLWLGSAQAQHPNVINITDEDGLPSLVIYDLIQDSKGFIWLGTARGLVRYDGQAFIQYESPDARGKAISGLMEDPYGRIWCQNFNNQVFYVQHDSMTLWKNWDRSPYRTFPDYDIGPDGIMWITGNHGIYAIDLATWEEKWVPDQTLQESGNIFHLAAIDSKQVFIGLTSMVLGKKTGGQINRYKFSKTFSDMAVLVPYNPIRLEKMGDHIVLTAPLSRKAFYILPDTFYVHPLQTSFQYVNEYLTRITIDRDQNYWISTYNGTFSFDGKTGHPREGFEHVLPGKNVSAVMQDTEGNYWIGTLSNGLYLITSPQLQLVDQTFSMLPDNFVSKLTSDGKSTIFLGLGNGQIAAFNTLTSSMSVYSFPENNKRIESIFYENGTLYFGGSGLFRHSLKTKNTETLFPLASVKAITSLKNNWKLILASGQTMILDGRKYYYELPEPPFTPLKAMTSRTGLFDPTGNKYYIGYKDYLQVIDQNGPREILDEKHSSVIPNHLYLDEDQTLWVGTINKGLLKLEANQLKSVEGWVESAGNTAITKIDGEGEMLWVATQSGLFRLNKSSGEIMSLFKKDGLVSDEINDMVILNGRVWIATAKGMQSVPLDYNETNTTPPPVYITRIQLGQKDTTVLSHYELKHDQNQFQAHFVGLTYSNISNKKFYYRLTPFDSDWLETNNQASFARYTGLEPGDYRFEVVAENIDGIRSLQSATFSLRIYPPFWLSWWFLLITVGMVTSGLMLTVRYRISQLQKSADEKLRKARLEQEARLSQLTALRSQMNPHFIFNALSSIQNFIFKNDKLNANIYLGKFSDLMRTILNFSESESVNLDDEIRSLQLYLDLESLRFNNQLDFTITGSDIPGKESIQIPPMVIQPYVENAIKHGLAHKTENRKLKIDFSLSKDHQFLIVKIDDNGIGRKRSTEINQLRQIRHQSFAHSATKKRLELLNAGRNDPIGVDFLDKVDNFGNATGTFVTITIPVENDAF